MPRKSKTNVVVVTYDIGKGAQLKLYLKDSLTHELTNKLDQALKCTQAQADPFIEWMQSLSPNGQWAILDTAAPLS